MLSHNIFLSLRLTTTVFKILLMCEKFDNSIWELDHLSFSCRKDNPQGKTLLILFACFVGVWFGQNNIQ